MSTNVEDDNKAQLILEKWVSSLPAKDRRQSAVSSNFDELFRRLKASNIPFDEAHLILDKAVKAHLPSPGLIRSVYKSIKSSRSETEKEFSEKWCNGIRNKAIASFYSFYEIDGENDEEHKQYGQMSPQEYRAQRKHADSFPAITFDKIKHLLDKQMDTSSFELELQKILDTIDDPREEE